MMTAEQYKEMWAGMDKPARNSYISALRERKPASAQYAETIKTLYYREYGRKIGGCVNCLLSAHFDIINGNIKGLKFKDMETNETKTAEAKYALRPGTVLYDRGNKDFSKILTAKNITDDLAKYHLALNPNALTRFVKYPENWKEEATEYAKANGLRSYLLEVIPPLKVPAAHTETESEVAKPEGEKPEAESALSEEEKAKIAEQYAQTPVAKTGRPSEK